MRDASFIKQIDVDEPVERVFGWHEKPGAFERLTPPWMHLKNIYRTGDGIKAGAKVSMDICVGGIPVPMRAEHVGYAKNQFFKDQLYGGIFSSWEHTHTFYSIMNNRTPIGHPALPTSTALINASTHATGSGSGEFSRLEERIDYTLPFHIPDKWHSFIKSELYRLFNYRHTVMLNDLERHRMHQLHRGNPKPLTILISGASGPVGNSLVPFLTTGGHRVIKLVRRATTTEATYKSSFKCQSHSAAKQINEIQWNPYAGELDLEPAGKIDVVINLNGYHIGSGRWTDQRKEIIIKSRNLSTTLLSDRVSNLPQDLRPELFISASATGFYGDCGDSSLNENSFSGDLFISRVCQEWETCAGKVEDAGIRTVFARMGVVLTPAGGALKRLLPGFMAGLGTKIGTGKQYMSWISMDDLIYALHHIMTDQSLNGAVNVISPEPVTNSQFTQTLARVISRPARFTLPASMIRMIWGEMGQEVLLSSARVTPDKLINSGFTFSHPDLEQALCHLLGKKQKYKQK